MHALGLGRREGDRVAEDVDRVGQPFARDARQHDLAHQCEVVVAPLAVLRRHDVRAEVGGAHGDAQLAAEPARDAQHAQLGLDVEAVARLDLDRGRAARDQRAQAPRRARRRASSSLGRARHRDGVRDAAAAGRRGDVALAGDPALEVGHPLAAEHQVRVRVDQARRDPAPAGVDHPRRQRLRRAGQRRARADPGDGAVARGQRAVGERAVGRTAEGHRRYARIGPERVVGCHRGYSAEAFHPGEQAAATATIASAPAAGRGGTGPSAQRSRASQWS